MAAFQKRVLALELWPLTHFVAVRRTTLGAARDKDRIVVEDLVEVAVQLSSRVVQPKLWETAADVSFTFMFRYVSLASLKLRLEVSALRFPGTEISLVADRQAPSPLTHHAILTVASSFLAASFDGVESFGKKISHENLSMDENWRRREREKREEREERERREREKKRREDGSGEKKTEAEGTILWRLT